jgi:hypothetical protein
MRLTEKAFTQISGAVAVINLSKHRLEAAFEMSAGRHIAARVECGYRL